MKLSHLFWLSLVTAAPIPGRAGLFGWGNSNEEKAEEEVVDKNASSFDPSIDRYSSEGEPLPMNENPIRNIIDKQRRYVLYNSRRLTGECIAACPAPETRPPLLGSTPDPTGSPTSSPTITPTRSPTSTPTKGPTNPPTSAGDMDCAKLANLGEDFSASTATNPGDSHFDNNLCYPQISQLNALNLKGRDDSVAVFVGGDFTSKNAAEVEGKVVVLGQLDVKNRGASNFVSVGLGSQVVPNDNTDCIIVGGNLVARRNVQMFNQGNLVCNMVYGGSATNLHRWKTGDGLIRYDSNYDMTFYEEMKVVWKKKSLYWKTLPSTGEATIVDSTTTFTCGTEPIQVFNIYKNEFSSFRTLTQNSSYQFSPECMGKTILFNVHGTGSVVVRASAMYDPNGGVGHHGFNRCFEKNILWNFPDAATVKIGKGGTSEWHGSLLVNGKLILQTSGHSGRTIVLGNLEHDRVGSEFHNYPYNPPTPLPDPPDVCELPDNLNANIGNYPTQNPTEPPQTQPPQTCVAIPQTRLPHGSWATNNAECGNCYPGSEQSWWPCDKNPPLCEGNCQLY